MPTPIRASIWFVVSSILQKGIAFLTMPVFARLMTKGQFGQYTIYNSWLEIFTIFATLNLFYGVYNNALTKYPDDRDVVTSSFQALCTTITLGLFFVYCALHVYINRITGMTTLMTLLLFVQVLFIPAFRFWAVKQRYEYKFKKLVILSLLVSLLTPLLGIPAVLLFEEKGYAKIITGAIAQIVVAVVLYIVIFKRGKTFYNKSYWKFALAFNLPLIPHYLSSTVLNQSDRLMINEICGVEKAGIYGLAYTIGAIAIIMNEAVMNSYTPYTYQKMKVGAFSDIRKNTRYLVVLVAIISIALVTLGPEIILIIGGDQYKEGMWIIAPIAASIFFRFLYGLYGNIEFYYEENYFIMIASVITAILNIVTNYIFINMYGYLAAGYTTLGCFAIYALAHCIFSSYIFKKHTGQKTPYDNSFILFTSITVIILCIAIMAIYNFPYLRYGIVLLFAISLIIMRKKIVEIVKLLRQK